MGNVDGAHEVAHALWSGHLIKAGKVVAETAAGEDAAGNVDHNGDAAALGASEGSEHSLAALRRIGGGVAVLVQRPALGNGLAQLLRQDQLAQRHGARGDIRHQRAGLGRAGEGQRVRAQIRLRRAEGGHIALEVGAAKAHHSGLSRHLGVEGRGAEVVGVAHSGKANARLSGFFDALGHGELSRRRAQRVAGIHRQGGGSLLHNADVVIGRHDPGLNTLHVDAQAAHAVGGHAGDLRIHQHFCRCFGANAIHAGGGHHIIAVLTQNRRRKLWHMNHLFRYFGVFP